MIVLVLGVLGLAGAALLSAAEEAPEVIPALGDPPVGAGGALPLARALRLTRFVLLVVATVSLASWTGWWTRSPGAAFVLLVTLTAGLYLTGDALPRALGLLRPDAARRALEVSRRLLAALHPIVALLAAADRWAHRLVPSARTPAGALGARQRDMLRGVFSLADTTVADVMTPRLDIRAVDVDAPWPELLDVVRRSEHARIPVYRDSLDDVLGMLFAKDLLPAATGAAPEPARWQDLIRPTPYVPEAKPLAAQLRDFQRGPAHLAIVVDEFGGTSGLITLEDVLEEVVGEIRDEHDTHELPAIEQEGEGRFWVDGRVTLDELSEILGEPMAREDVSTVGGLIYSELGRVPRPGEELRLSGCRVVVEQVVRRRIRRVYFERADDDVLAQRSRAEESIG